jgi:uncharacterized Tic20 family protein
MSIADDLERLRQLYQTGDLSDEEYAQAKAAALGQSSQNPSGRNVGSYGGPEPSRPREDSWQAPGSGFFDSAGRSQANAPREPQQSRARSSMAGWLSENEWAMMLHLSQFAGYVAPLLGFIVPILIWQILKDELPSLDRHGRVVMNWMVSSLLYAIVCVILTFALVGVPLLLILAVLAIVFPIIAALKANGGELWPYPLSIHFFGVNQSQGFDNRPGSNDWE